MSGKKIVFPAFFLIGIGMMVTALSARASVLATVNGQTITEGDVKAALSILSEGQRKSFLEDRNSRRRIILGIIDRKILAKEGEKIKLDQEQAFKDQINANREHLLMIKLLEKKVAPQLTTSAVKNFYKAHLDWFSTDRVHVQHILLSTEEEARKMLEKAKESGADFMELAEKYSNDPTAKNNRGDIGFVGHGDADEDFTRFAFSVNSGEIRGPVQSIYGYHIIKVIEKKKGKPLEYDEVELRVKSALEQELIRNYTFSLKGDAKIKVNHEELEKLRL